MKNNRKTDKAKRTTESKAKEKGQRPLSKCAFIDSLLEKGGMTMDEIAKKAHAKFGGDLKSTLSTCKVRPFHMRKAGKKPLWEKAKE
jgi:hypothetical protein